MRFARPFEYRDHRKTPTLQLWPIRRHERLVEKSLAFTYARVARNHLGAAGVGGASGLLGTGQPLVLRLFVRTPSTSGQASAGAQIPSPSVSTHTSGANSTESTTRIDGQPSPCVKPGPIAEPNCQSSASFTCNPSSSSSGVARREKAWSPATTVLPK